MILSFTEVFDYNFNAFWDKLDAVVIALKSFFVNFTSIFNIFLQRIDSSSTNLASYFVFLFAIVIAIVVVRLWSN